MTNTGVDSAIEARVEITVPVVPPRSAATVPSVTPVTAMSTAEIVTSSAVVPMRPPIMSDTFCR